MKDITVGVIGGTRGMGRWFARLLHREGFKVYICGRKTKRTAADLVTTCNVIVVSVPIAATAGVISEVGPRMGVGSLLMDLTSLKKEPVELMLSCSSADVVGCHPLFGPSLKNIRGQNVVLCPARGRKWLLWLQNLFVRKGLNVLKRTPEEHDKMMSIVQAFNHLNTIEFALGLAATGIPLAEISVFSTPVFQSKVATVKKLFTENPGLYTDIIIRNTSKEKILNRCEKAAADIHRVIKCGDSAEMQKKMEQAAKKLFPGYFPAAR